MSDQVSVLGVNAPANREEHKVTVLQCVCSDKKNAWVVNIFLRKGGYLGLFMSGPLHRKRSGSDVGRNSHYFNDSSRF